jgi:lysine 2,3-aminomutase
MGLQKVPKHLKILNMRDFTNSIDQELLNKKMNVTSKFDVVSLSDEEKYYYAKSEKERKTVDEVIKKYPVKITSYLREMMKSSEALRKQYLPSPAEFTTNGTATPFEEGKESAKTYGLERLYRDRVLIAPNFDCPAYCRYCYKKSRYLLEY